MKDPLVWIDCEMTGLDVSSDALIEVAVVVTDGDLTIVDPGMDVLITPPAEALDNMNDFVRNMHTSSGLLDDLRDVGCLHGRGNRAGPVLHQALRAPAGQGAPGGQLGGHRQDVP